MNKREAIREVRALANDTIDQLERLAAGWDRDNLRDDWNGQGSATRAAPSVRLRENSREAFDIAKQFA